MKTTLRLSIAALGLAMFTVSTATVQAQFNYTTNNGTITITGYTGPGGAVIIPSTINGLPVTSIEGYAFQGCTSLTSIVIPNSVTSIGDWAFSDCSSLMSVTIPNGVTSMGGALFVSCTSLTNAVIGDGVTSIPMWGCGCCVAIGAFQGCTSLTGVYFKGNAPDCWGGTFEGATNATVYYLPGTTGWGTTYGGRPTTLWVLPNPLILNSGPSFGVQTNHFGFRISWATNASVVVEASTTLANPVWSPLSTNALAAGWCDFRDAEWTSQPARFYRIRSQ